MQADAIKKRTRQYGYHIHIPCSFFYFSEKFLLCFRKSISSVNARRAHLSHTRHFSIGDSPETSCPVLQPVASIAKMAVTISASIFLFLFIVLCILPKIILTARVSSILQPAVLSDLFPSKILSILFYALIIEHV